MKRAVQFAANAVAVMVVAVLLFPIVLLLRDGGRGLAGNAVDFVRDLRIAGTFSTRQALPLALHQAANGAVIAAVVALLCSGLAPGAAHTLTLHRSKRLSRGWLIFAGVVVLAPVTALLIPVHIVLNAIGQRDSMTGVAFVEVGLSLPVAIWIMKSAFEELPPELVEAARFEGVSAYRAYRGVALPLVRGAQAMTFAIIFVLSWGEYFVASTLLTRADAQTLGASLVENARSGARAWEHLAPGVLFAALPGAAVVLLLHTRMSRLAGRGRWLREDSLD